MWLDNSKVVHISAIFLWFFKKMTKMLLAKAFWLEISPKKLFVAPGLLGILEYRTKLNLSQENEPIQNFSPQNAHQISS